MKNKTLRIMIQIIPCIIVTVLVWVFNDMSLKETLIDVTRHLWRG